MMQHSLSDTYLLASKVKSRLTKEAVKSNVNLRVLVCQANLLDNLIDYLNSSTDESNTSSNNNSDTEEDKLENNNNNKNVESKVSFDDIEEGDLSVTVHQERENQHDSKTKITTSEILLSDDEEQDDDSDHNNSEITDAMEISRLNKLSHIEDNTSFEEYYEYDDSSDDDSDYESDYEYVYEDVSSDEGEDEEDEEQILSESKLESQVDNEEEEDEDEDVEYSTDVRLNLTRCHSQNEDSNLARLQKTSNLYLAPEKSVLQSTEDLGLSRLNSLIDEEQIEEIEEEEIESDTNHHDLPSLSYCSSASSSDIEDNESDDHSHHHHHHHHHNHNNQTKDTINDNKQSKNINSNIYPAVEECDLGDINELTKMYGQTNAPQPHLVYA